MYTFYASIQLKCVLFRKSRNTGKVFCTVYKEVIQSTVETVRIEKSIPFRRSRSENTTFYFINKALVDFISYRFKCAAEKGMF